MPVVINEIQITAVVEDSGAAAEQPDSAAGSSREIISACVEEVLRILKEKEER